MIELDDFYIGIKYDYTSTKFYFTVKQPVSEINEEESSHSFLLEIDGVIAEQPCTVLYANGMKVGNYYVWQHLIHSNNLWKDYLKLHVGEEIDVTVHDGEDIHVYTPTLYYRSDSVEKGKSTVELPNTGWQIGAYDIEVVYPPTRHYEQSSLNTQLAYKTWNWLSRIYCEGADEDGKIMMYPSESTELIFNVVDKDDKPINTGAVEVILSDIYAETQIYANDLVLEEGTAGDMNYTISTISMNPEPVDHGEVSINETIQSIEIVGDLTSVNEWVSSQSIATAQSNYVPASSSNNTVGSGINCVTYWNTFTLIPNTSIKFVINGLANQEFAFGLIDTATERALFTFKHETDNVVNFIQDENSTEYELPIENNVAYYFTHEYGQINFGTETHKFPIADATSTYKFFIQGYDTLATIKCTYIKGGYGSEI